DQYFLRQRIWPTVRQSVLSHDSQFSFPGNQAFPIVPNAALGGINYVGANLSEIKLRIILDAPAGTLIEWSLLDQYGAVFCTYEGLIHDGCYSVHFPHFLLRKIDSGELKVQVAVKSVPRQG
ncbi:MAG: hypothetical protein LBE21_08740, partial [Pseudomonadales bacterium]|nr:hypothetical protein [Pseudomonadales bacterium]